MTPCINAPVPKGNRYPRVRVDGKRVQLSRVVYCAHHGVPLSDIYGKVVRHKCDNTACVNPEHLEIGTHAENMADMVQRGRSTTPRNRGERNPNAKLTAEDAEYIRNVYVFRCAEFGRNALAKKFGVAGSVISKITRGQSWTQTNG